MRTENSVLLDICAQYRLTISSTGYDCGCFHNDRLSFGAKLHECVAFKISDVTVQE